MLLCSRLVGQYAQDYAVKCIGIVKRFAATRRWRFRRRKQSATAQLDTMNNASLNH